MFYLFANSWGWLAVALAVGLVVGFLTTTRAQKEFSGGWVILVGALLLATGFVASFNGAFAGRSAVFVDAALLLATAYAIGLPLGGGAKLFAGAPAPERPAKRPQIVVVRGKARESEPESETTRETGAAPAAVVTGEVAEPSTAAAERMETAAAAVESAEAPAAVAALGETAIATEVAEEPIFVAAETVETFAEGAAQEAALAAAVETAEQPVAVALAEAAEAPAAVAAAEETPNAAAETTEQQAAVMAEAFATSAAIAEPEERPIATSDAANEPASSIVVAPPAPAAVVTNGSGKKSPAARPDALEAPRGGKPDDLSKIKGVGPKSQEKLHALGVFHYDQIAAWTPEQARWIGGALGVPGRVERGRWVAQAKSLASGKQAHPE
jgi:predicted flap endonuclease-1-like 5' DNA nuclease